MTPDRHVGRDARAFVLLAFVSALLFAAATPATKVLLRGLDPLPLAGWLYLGAALGVLPLALRAGARRRTRRISRRNALRLAGAALCGGVLGQVALLLALRLASAVSVSLWLNLEAVATALFGQFLFRDRLGRRGVIGVAGALGAGTLLATSEGAVGGAALLLVALACGFWGLDNHLTALIDEITPEEITLAKGLTAGSVNLATAAFLGSPLLGTAAGHPGAAVGTGAIGALLVGVFAYGWSITFYIRSARELGATRAHFIYASAPFLGAIISWAILRESLGWRHAATVPILAASIALLLADRHEHEHVHEALEHEHAHRHDDGHHNHAHPGIPPGTRHTHRHRHEPAVHHHPHWPDLHHRHDHAHVTPETGCAGPPDAVFSSEPET